MTKDRRRPAFPHVRDDGYVDEPGMSLRDYFAGQALIGVWSHNEFIDGIMQEVDHDMDVVVTVTASLAYTQADAMMEERENDSQ